MSSPSIIGFSGNISRPSKTRALVQHVALAIAPDSDLEADIFDIEDLGPSLADARSIGQLDGRAAEIVRRIVDADLLVVGTPTYKGSYTGLFKHFFDLLEPSALRGKPVALTATGGGDRHSLVVEHQLRPLFGFFEAFTLPTAIYASNGDFRDSANVSDVIAQRVAQLASEAQSLLAARAPTAIVPPRAVRWPAAAA